mmetsp:Transcript_32712/g.31938  ORF Transcript_32712/g.31938 Transcript_32712/m.31938 type:complete len:104 (+) Transcript_32712:31-342(+)
MNWFMGFGAIALENLMEDFSTVEICRIQLWLWAKHRVFIQDSFLEMEFIMKAIDAEAMKIKTLQKDSLAQAKVALKSLVKSKELANSFMDVTLPLLDSHVAKL